MANITTVPSGNSTQTFRDKFGILATEERW